MSRVPLQITALSNTAVAARPRVEEKPQIQALERHRVGVCRAPPNSLGGARHLARPFQQARENLSMVGH
ncbi:hypothetical protein ACWGLG_17135 [Streptomyces antimycoticus]